MASHRRNSIQLRPRLHPAVDAISLSFCYVDCDLLRRTIQNMMKLVRRDGVLGMSSAMLSRSH